MANEFGNKAQAVTQAIRDNPAGFAEALIDTANEVLSGPDKQAMLQGILSRMGLDVIPSSMPIDKARKFQAGMEILKSISADPEGFGSSDTAQDIADMVLAEKPE